jgi:hypothetical protein
MSDLDFKASLRQMGKTCGLRTWARKRSTDIQGYYDFLETVGKNYESRTGSRPSLNYLAKSLALLLDEEGHLLAHILKKNAVRITDEGVWESVCLAAAMTIVEEYSKRDDGNDG